MKRLWAALDALVLWLHDSGVPVRKLFVGIEAFHGVCMAAEHSHWGATYTLGFWLWVAFMVPLMSLLIVVTLVTSAQMWNWSVGRGRRRLTVFFMTGSVLLQSAHWGSTADWREGVFTFSTIAVGLVVLTCLPTRPPRPRRKVSRVTNLAWSPS